MTHQRIAVVGAGIGGLTLAIALRARGLGVDLYEATAELREVGAAVALSANATRHLADLGLGEQLDEVAADIDTLVWRDGRDGRVIGLHRPEPAYRERFHGPYLGVHRATLQQILSAAAGPERIHLSKRLTAIDDGPDAAVLHFADGTSAEADLVIGADGARSTVRRLLLGYDDALYSGCSGFRGIVPIADLPSLPDPHAIQFWMGPGGHLLHYPLSATEVNFLLVERHPSPWPAREWVAPSTEGDQLRHFGDWHPAVVEMITAVGISQRWGLFHRPPLSRWSRGRVTLIGDAAHALVPHHGQGANQSIEDAVVLADVIGRRGLDDLPAVQAELEGLRRGRTRKVQHASITTADVLHLPDGPLAQQRDARLGSPEGAERHLGWIHGFDALASAPDDRAGGSWL